MGNIAKSFDCLKRAKDTKTVSGQNITNLLYYVMWSIEYDARAEAWLYSLQPDVKAKILRIIDMMLTLGPMNVHEPQVKHIEGHKKLFEIRAKGKDSIARAFYFTMAEQRIIILHGFTKKTPKTPKAEIEIALKRMQEVLHGKT